MTKAYNKKTWIKIKTGNVKIKANLKLYLNTIIVYTVNK